MNDIARKSVRQFISQHFGIIILSRFAHAQLSHFAIQIGPMQAQEPCRFAHFFTNAKDCSAKKVLLEKIRRLNEP